MRFVYRVTRITQDGPTYPAEVVDEFNGLIVLPPDRCERAKILSDTRPDEI